MANYTLDDELLEAIADTALGFYPPGTTVDWDDLLYRVETTMGIDLPQEMLHPDIVKIQKYVRKARREASE